jgi:hypothetical protein
MGNERPGLAQSKTQLAKKSLALAHSQVNPESLFDKGRQGLAIPEMSSQPKYLRRLPQCAGNRQELELIEGWWPTWAFGFCQTCEASLDKLFNPILHGSRGVTKALSHLSTRQALGHQENYVQPMIITGFMGTTNLRLETHYDRFCVRYGQRSHVQTIPKYSYMRNYL